MYQYHAQQNMRNFFSIITDKLSKTTYKSTFTVTKNINDDNIIINLISKFVLPILMLFGFYIHSHGDYTPGGGFQAGVIFACALCLYCFINLDANKKRISNNFLTYIAILGFVFYTGTGIVGYFITGNFLDFTFLPFKQSNSRGVFIIEFGIALVVFSSISQAFTTLLNLIKEAK